jgi:hypothetical protein
MAFGNSNDIEIQIRLEAEKTRQQLAELTKSVDKLSGSLSNASKAADKTENDLNSLASNAGKLATGAIVSLTGAFFAFRKVIDIGDKLGDVRNGFEETARSAGVLSDKLLKDLNAASKNAVTNLSLMSQATKALELGIAADQIDDLAFAAQRYADNHGKDFVDSFDQLITAVKTGRQSTLDLFGTVNDGSLVIDKFTEAQAASFEATKSVSDVLDEMEKNFVDALREAAAFINESTILVNSLIAIKEAGEAVVGVLQSIANALPKASSVLQALSGVPGIGPVAGSLATQLKVYEDLYAFSTKLTTAFAGTAKVSNTAATEIVKVGKGSETAAKGMKEAEKAANALKSAISNISKSVGFDQFPGLTGQVKGIFAGSDDPKVLADAFAKLAGETQKAGVPLEELLERIRSVKEELKDADAFAFDFAKEAFEDASAAAAQFNDTLLNLGSDLSNLFSTISSGDAFDVGNFGNTFGNIGSVIAGPIGGQIGSLVGGLTDTIATLFSSEDAGTTARKAVDKYFADLFDEDRLSVIVGGKLKRINDLAFEGNFNAPEGGIPAGFIGVGAGFEQLLGVTEDISGQIAAVLSNNVGGSLNNLQLLVQATGVSFLELGDAIIESFLNGALSIQEAQVALEGLAQVFTAGIPGAIGAIDEAYTNFQIAIAEDRGSRALIDSIRDIGAEAQELGVRTLPALADQLTRVFGFSANQVAAFFDAMKATGITSIQQLVDASTSTLIAFAANFQNIMNGIAATAKPILDTTQNTQSPSNFSSGGFRSSSFGGGGIKRNTQHLDDMKKKVKEVDKALNLNSLKQFGKDLNFMGIAADALGISLDATKKRIVDTFKAGKLSIKEANDEIKKATDLLGGGIPGAVGAVSDAFRNLLKGGTKGGAFSIDSFKDIFAEAKEKFVKELSPARAAEFQRLSENFEKLKGNPGSDEFKGAKKALDDFMETIPKIGFDDLRSFLEQNFDKGTVQKFFQAISESGINSFDGLENASEDAIVGIIAKLEELQFPFSETSAEVEKLNQTIADLTSKQHDVEVKFKVSADFDDAGTKSVFDLLYGAGLLGDNTSSSKNGLNAAERAEFSRLSRLSKQKGRLSPADRKRYDALRRAA